MPGLLGARTPAPTSPTSQTRAEPRRRRVGDHRPEGVDVARALGRLVLRACRTDRDAPKHKGLSYLLVPMDQPGDRDPADRADHRARRSSTRCSSTARAPPADNVVGEVNGGWRVAMGTLAFERGALDARPAARVRERAATRSSRDRAASRARATIRCMRQRLADAWIGLRIMRFNALRDAHADGERGEVDAARRRSTSSSGRRSTARSASSRSTCSGREAEIADGAALRADARCSACSSTRRADTIYGGSNQIQRNVIGERALGLPPSGSRAHDASRPPPYPPGHGLLDGQDGARHRGRRHRHRLRDREALRRGRRAPSSISDIHERRLARGGRRSSGDRGERPLAVLCDVTRRGRRAARCSTARSPSTGRARRAGQQRRPRRHREPRRHDRRAVARRCST